MEIPMEAVLQRLQWLEDRIALQDLIIEYCAQIDRSNVEGVLGCFVEDGVLDLTGLGLPRLQGRTEIRDFFSSVFATMAYNGHYSSNFKLDALNGDRASAHAYVHAVGKSTEGGDVLVYAKHEFDAVRTEDGWKIAEFREPFLVPSGEEIPEF